MRASDGIDVLRRGIEQARAEFRRSGDLGALDLSWRLEKQLAQTIPAPAQPRPPRQMRLGLELAAEERRAHP